MDLWKEKAERRISMSSSKGDRTPLKSPIAKSNRKPEKVSVGVNTKLTRSIGTSTVEEG